MSIKTLNDDLDDVPNKAGAAGGALALVTGGLSAIADAAASAGGILVDFIGNTITAAEKHQDVMMQLADAEENYAQNAHESLSTVSRWMEDEATSLSKVTRYSYDSVSAAESVLLKFKSIGMDVMPDATVAAADLAAKMGTDLPTAAQALGRALEDSGAGVTRLNAQYNLFNPTQLKTIQLLEKQGKTADAQRAILDALNKNIGGLAEDMGSTAAGAMTILNNTFGDLTRTIGDTFLPAIADLAKGVAPMVQDLIPKFADFFQNKVAPALKQGADGVLDFVNSLVTGTKPTTDIGQKIAQVVQDVGGFITNVVNFAGKVGDLVSGVSTTISNISSAITTGVTVAKTTISAAANDFFAGGVLWVTQLITGIHSVITNISTDISTAIKNAVNTVNGYAAAFQTAGQALIDGIIAGIKAKMGELVAQAIIAAEGALQAAKKALGISSPSKAFMEVGYNISLGMAQGILSGAHLPQLALASISNGAIGSATYNNQQSTTNTTNIYNMGMSLYRPESSNASDVQQMFRRS